MNDNKIKFSIAGRVATHLGRNLYSSNPPALAELVANSYDAYATKVYIKIDNNKIYIIDNGKGMSIDEINHKYAIIGIEKQKEEPFNGLNQRAPMGQKGIGKLAAFSLGEKYTVYTKTLGKKQWLSFELIYNDFIKDETTHSVDYKFIDDLPNDLKEYTGYTSGFIIKIDNLIRNSRNVYSTLSTQLSRRFYIASSVDKFEVFLNDKKVDLLTHEYYKDIDFLVYFGYKKDEINNMFPNIDEAKKIRYEANEDLRDYFQRNNGLKGWFGSVITPRQLQTKDYNFNSVIVYINKKIADENIFKNSGSARIANQYLVGEVHADFLLDILQVPITSSRDGLDRSNVYVEEFIEILAKIRSKFTELWTEIRQKEAIIKLPNFIKDNESYKNWLDGLNSKQKEMNKKLLALLVNKSFADQDEETQKDEIQNIVSSIVKTVDNMEFSEIQKILSTIETVDDNHIELINKLMSKIERAETLNVFELVKERVVAIYELEKLMSGNNILEKFFNEHLYKHPWLINPHWNQDLNDKNNFEIFKGKYFKAIDQDDEFKKNYIDLLIKVAEERYPIIVELKKNTPTGHARVTFGKMMDQIKKYRCAVKQSSTEYENINDTDIKVYFIISEDSGVNNVNTINFSDSDMTMFKAANIEILKYSKLIDRARRSYADFINIINAEKKIPNFN